MYNPTDTHVFLDFEFAHSYRKNMDVVCCSMDIHEAGKVHSFDIWLRNDMEGQERLRKICRKLKKKGAIFYAYLASAECRSLRSVGIEPLDHLWICLFSEWRQLRYNNHRRMYGRYLRQHGMSAATGSLSYGKNGYSTPPSMCKADNVGKDNTEVQSSLAAVTYHLLGKTLDTAHKDEMRDLIISAPAKFTEQEKTDILDYCRSDIIYLAQLAEKIGGEIMDNFNLSRHQYREIALERGRYAGPVIAQIERNGMPFRLEAANHLSANVDAARDSLIAEYSGRVEIPFYLRQKRTLKDFRGHWVEKYSRFEEYISSKPEYKNWPRTESGRLSRDDSDLKMCGGDVTLSEYRNLRKALKGLESFDPNSKSAKTSGMVMDSVDVDGRLRILFGVFGTMTGRNAPRARRFPFAMGAWARCMLGAEPGGSICMIDYSSQEFLVAAILSGDPAMIAAYDSGDPYLWFAQSAGAVPWDGTKKTHPKERDLFKATTLGLQFGMGSENLARKLTVDCGREVTLNEAKKLIALHRRIYRVYWKWAEKTIRTYKRDGYLLLCDGWGINCHCLRELSVRNFPVQGTAAVILRRATVKAVELGVPIIAPLHDAEYFCSQDDVYEEHKANLVKAMNWAVSETLGESAKMRQDIERHEHGHIWVEPRATAVYKSLEPFMSEYETPEAKRLANTKKLLQTTCKP